MIIDVFPKAGGTPVTLKNKPYSDVLHVQAPANASNASTYPIKWYRGKRQQMAPSANNVLYIIGEATTGSSYSYGDHLIKIDYTPYDGYVIDWIISDFSTQFVRIIVDDDNYVYAVRSNGNLEKYNPDGEVLWSIAESGVLCIGANGNLFSWTNTYFKEYDTNGNLLNTWEYVCNGTPLVFYVNADEEFFIATNSELARISSLMETLWTYAIPFKYEEYVTAVDIDHQGNFYTYDLVAKNEDDVVGVQCINSNGELIWATGRVYYSFSCVNICVDNLGGVYLLCYSGDLFKFDAKTGSKLWSMPIGSMAYRCFGSDRYGNAYVWSSGITGIHTYLGTVGWSERGETKERFVVQELERGDNYIILLDDSEVATS